MRASMAILTTFLSSVTHAAFPMLSGTLDAITGTSRNGIEQSEFRLEPRVDWSWGSTHFTGKARLRADASGHLRTEAIDNAMRSTASSRMEIGARGDLELRELYADTTIGSAQIRLGKQQVVWGQADGLRVLDVINPLSYREFLLGDFEDRRSPLWMLNAEIPIGDDMLQLIVVPDQTYDELPSDGSTFRFAVLEGVDLDVDRPNDPLNDADVGIRWSRFAGGWDVSLNYLYHYIDSPRLSFESLTRATASYERAHLIGGTASTAFGDFVLRAELGYADEVFDNTTATETHELSGVIGLDYSGVSETFLSMQLFVADTDTDTARRATILATRDVMNDALVLEALAIHDLSDGDGVVQLSAGYQLTSSAQLRVGADVFYGSATDTFGQFDGEDRLTFGFELSF